MQRMTQKVAHLSKTTYLRSGLCAVESREGVGVHVGIGTRWGYLWKSTDLALQVIRGQFGVSRVGVGRSSGFSHNEAKVEAAYGNFNIETSRVGMIEFSRELWKAVSSFSLALVFSLLCP